MIKIPSNYLVSGLEAVHYNKPDNSCEAVEYITPNGTKFTLAKDFMGIQFCKNGKFWPPPFSSFHSMGEAVACLKDNIISAITFFDKVEIERKVG